MSSAIAPAPSAYNYKAIFWTLGLSVLVVAVWSYIAPHDRLTWWLESAPALIAAPILAWTYSRFPLTPLLYFSIAVHSIVLLVGGHYTYAEVPLGYWLQHVFSLPRNPYDGIGHFMQGVTPALLTRELLIRRAVIRRERSGWLFYIVFSICMAFSAVYELFEWQSAVWLGSGADDFLGTQGDPWDTQKDMALCGVGALFVLLVLARWQNKQMERI